MVGTPLGHLSGWPITEVYDQKRLFHRAITVGLRGLYHFEQERPLKVLSRLLTEVGEIPGLTSVKERVRTLRRVTPCIAPGLGINLSC